MKNRVRHVIAAHHVTVMLLKAEVRQILTLVKIILGKVMSSAVYLGPVVHHAGNFISAVPPRTGQKSGSEWRTFPHKP